jgi:hypothetical protein
MTCLWISQASISLFRYNPDKFKDKYGKMKNPFFDTRMEVLENVINKHMLRIIAEDNEDFIRNTSFIL